MQVTLLSKYHQIYSAENYLKGYAEDSKIVFPEFELSKTDILLKKGTFSKLFSDCETLIKPKKTLYTL